MIIFLLNLITKRIMIFLPRFQTYLYGTPIGLALGLRQEVITHILEQHNSMEEVARELGKAANDHCRITYPAYEYNEHIVRDLMRTMLTKSA